MKHRPDHPRAGSRRAAGRLALGLALEAALFRMARGAGTLDLGLGEALLALQSSDRLLALGFSRITDYARERLGVPASTALSWIQLARETKERPLLRRAVLAGLVSPRKALLVSRVAAGDDEAAWTAAASSLTEAELRRRVTASGGSLPPEWRVETLLVRMAPDQQARVDAALAVAREVLGPDKPRWQLVEAFAMEFLGAHGAWMDVETPPLRSDDVTGAEAGDDWLAAWRERAPDVLRQLEALDLASSLANGTSSETTDPHVLDARLRRLVAARRGSDGPLGRQADLVRRIRVWAALGFETFEEYCRDRHHLEAIHRGYITVEGRAGERLTWRLGIRDGVPGEVWIVLDDDDVRRSG